MLGTAEKDAIRARIQTLQNITGKDEEEVAKNIARELGMQKGSRIYEKFATTSKYYQFAGKSKDKIRGQLLNAYRESSAMETKLTPMISADYKPYTDKIVKDIHGHFREMINAEKIMEDADFTKMDIDFNIAHRRQTLATYLDQMMQELFENKKVGNILDVYDTMEASIREHVGERGVKVLREAIAAPGQPDDISTRLIEIHGESMDRRAAKVINARTAQNVVDQIHDIETFQLPQLNAVNERRMQEIAGKKGVAYSAPDPLSLLNLDQYTAKGLVNQMNKELNELIQSGAVGSGTTVPQHYGISQEAYDFLRATAGHTRDLNNEVAQQQGEYVRATKRQAEIEAKYGTGASPAATPPAPTAYTSHVEDIIKSVDEAAIKASSPAPDKLYTRLGRMFKSGGMKELFEDSFIRNSAYAMVGLAAFGFIYSARKDRTQDEIQGPPLLPGGSAYESDFPKAMPSISDLKYLNPTTAAMSYKIHVNGSQKDVEKLQQLAGGVAQGPINTTMYDGLPRLGRDPYSSVASSF